MPASERGDNSRPPGLPKSSGRRPRQQTPAQREKTQARQKVFNQRRRKASDSNDALRDGVIVLETDEHRQRRLALQREYNRSRQSRRSRNRIDDADADSVVTETNAHREQRLLRQREYYHGSRAEVVPPDSLADSTRLEPVTPEVIKEIEELLQDALGAEGLDECVCAVCDRLVLRNTCQAVGAGESTCFKNIQRVLQAPASLPETLVKEYCCGDLHDDLAGLMLSRKGILRTSSGVQLSVCKECYSPLLVNTGAPPKFAIANGFFVGSLPEHLANASWTERVMTQLVTVVAQTRIMRGGRHRAIRSHCMVFDSTPGPPATLLPRRIDRESTYRVVLAGPFTSEQTDRIRKLHEVRGQMVTSLLAFFKSNNPFYADVRIDADAIRVIQLATAYLSIMKKNTSPAQ